VDVLTRIHELLEQADDETVNTSMRLPAALREAAALAVSELGIAASTTTLAAEALRARLEAIVERHPDADADDVLLWAEALASTAA